MSQAVDIFSKILQLPNSLTSGDSGLRGAKGPTGITVPVIAPNHPQGGATIHLVGTVSFGVGLVIDDNENPLRGTYRIDDRNDAISTTQEMASWVADEINRLEGISGWDFTNEGRTWYYIATATGNNINIKRSDNQPVQIQVDAYDSTFTATVTNQNRELRTGVKEDKGYLYLFLNGAWKELEMEAVNEVVARPVLTSSTQLQITFYGSMDNINWETIQVFSGDRQVQSATMSLASNALTSVLEWNAEEPFTDDLHIVYPSNLPDDQVSYTDFVEGSLSGLLLAERVNLTITGTVTYIDISGGFYGVLGDDGSKYVVVNKKLKDWDQQRVTITGYSTPDIVTIFMWGKPIWASQITVVEEKEEEKEEEEEEAQEEEEKVDDPADAEEEEKEDDPADAPLANVILSNYAQEKLDGGSYWNNVRITAIQPNAIYINDPDMTYPWSWNEEENAYVLREKYTESYISVTENPITLTYTYMRLEDGEWPNVTSRLKLRPLISTDVAAPLVNVTLANYRQENLGNGSYWETRTITGIQAAYITVNTTSRAFHYIWNHTDAAYIWTGTDSSLRIEVTSNADGTYTLNKTGGTTGPGQLQLTDLEEEDPADAAEGGDGSSPEQAIVVGTVAFSQTAITIDTFDSVTGDTEMGLYHSSGIRLAENEDAHGETRKSELTLTMNPGTYYVAAGSFDMTFLDNFQVSGNYNNNIRLTINRDQGTSEVWATGSNARGPVWFSFEVTA